MKTKEIDSEQIRRLPKSAIARKYNCSVQYVRKILQGKYQINSERSRKILQDAMDILEIIERETPLEK